MDLQPVKPQTEGLLSRRFWAREVFSCAESRTAAMVYGGISFLLSFLFARTHALFGVYPFALAYLGACRRRFPFAFAGALCGALTLGSRGAVYGAAYVFLLGLRLLFSHPRRAGRFFPASPGYFEEDATISTAGVCLSGFLLAVYELAVGGLSATSLAFAAGMILLPTVFCVLYSDYFLRGESPLSLLLAEPTRARSLAALKRTLSLAAFSFTFVLGLRGAEVFGLSLSVAAAVFFCLFYAGKYGSLCGSAAALLTALGTWEARYLPAFLTLALCAALLAPLRQLFVVLGSVAASGTVAYLMAGNAAILSYFPELVFTVTLSYPLFRGMPRVSAHLAAEREKERAAAQEEMYRRLPAAARMEMLSSVFSSLCEVFTHLSEVSARPGEGEFRRMAEEAFSDFCAECADPAGCRAADARRMLVAAFREGCPPASLSLPDGVMANCGCRDAIVRRTAERFLSLTEEKRRRDRNGIFAESYRMSAEMLRDAAERERREAREEKTLSRRAAAVFSEMQLPARSVTVFGDRCHYLTARGVSWNADHPDEKELRHRLEEICACRLRPLSVTEEGGTVTLRTESTPCLRVKAYSAGEARGEEASGDAFSTFTGDGGLFFALLTDGMGSGHEAAITAGLCGAFLHQTLAAGSSRHTAIAALNRLLREREEECSAAVDLFSLNCLTGYANFLKGGAAASFIRRGESLFRIRAGTLPIGILRDAEIEDNSFSLLPGDRVILLSDGVCPAAEEAVWLCELLGGSEMEDPAAMAKKILAAARRENEERDDRTVAILTVEEIPEAEKKTA